MRLLAIDPANEQTAYVLVETNGMEIIDKGKIPNDEFIKLLELGEYDHMAIEILVNMGRTGATLFETAEMIGKCMYINSVNNKPYTRISRQKVKVHFQVKRKLNGVKAPSADSQIRTSLINRFGEVGTKKNQGYFYGFKADIWQAMAVCVYTTDKKLGS